jgi:superfamily II DNA/RNA helicase
MCVSTLATPTKHTKSTFKFSSKEGRSLVLQILLKKLPYHPHDFQLEGVCAVLDGKDVLAIVPTGSGKTGLFFMCMLVLEKLSEELGLCPERKFMKNLLMLAVHPTNYIEDQTVCDPQFLITDQAANVIRTLSIYNVFVSVCQ